MQPSAKDLIEAKLKGTAYPQHVVQAVLADKKIVKLAKSMVFYRKNDTGWAEFRLRIHSLLIGIAEDYWKYGKIKTASVKKDFDFYTSGLDWYVEEVKAYHEAFKVALKKYSDEDKKKTTSEAEMHVTESLDDGTLEELIDMAAESLDYELARGARVTSQVKRKAQQFEQTLLKALAQWVRKNPQAMADEEDEHDLFDDEGGYAVFMTLAGHGVGIWDGRWDHHFVQPKKAIPALEKWLKRSLGKFVDDTGSGSLNQAIYDAAYEQSGMDESVQEAAMKLSKGKRYAATGELNVTFHNTKSLSQLKSGNVPVYAKSNFSAVSSHINAGHVIKYLGTVNFDGETHHVFSPENQMYRGELATIRDGSTYFKFFLPRHISAVESSFDRFKDKDPIQFSAPKPILSKLVKLYALMDKADTYGDFTDEISSGWAHMREMLSGKTPATYYHIHNYLLDMRDIKRNREATPELISMADKVFGLLDGIQDKLKKLDKERLRARRESEPKSAKALIDAVMDGADAKELLTEADSIAPYVPPKNIKYPVKVIQDAYEDVYDRYAKPLQDREKKDRKRNPGDKWRTPMYSVIGSVGEDYLKFGKIKTASVKKDYDYYTTGPLAKYFGADLKRWFAEFEKAVAKRLAEYKANPAESIDEAEDLPPGYKTHKAKVTIKKVSMGNSQGVDFVMAGRVKDDYLKDQIGSFSYGTDADMEINAFKKNGYSDEEIKALYKEMKAAGGREIVLPKPLKLTMTVLRKGK